MSGREIVMARAAAAELSFLSRFGSARVVNESKDFLGIADDEAWARPE